MSDNTNDAGAIPGHPTAIKEITIEPGSSFMANGKEYFVSETFTIGRLERVTLMEEELVMLGDQGSCHQVMLRAMEQINSYKPGDAYTLLYNKIESDKKNAKLMHYAIRACTAYINYAGENMGYLTEEQIRTKINDWSVEGLDVRPFIIFAGIVFREHLAPYSQDMANILSEAKKISEAVNTATDMPSSTSSPSNGNPKS